MGITSQRGKSYMYVYDELHRLAIETIFETPHARGRAYMYVLQYLRF